MAAKGHAPFHRPAANGAPPDPPICFDGGCQRMLRSADVAVWAPYATNSRDSQPLGERSGAIMTTLLADSPPKLNVVNPDVPSNEMRDRLLDDQITLFEQPIAHVVSGQVRGDNVQCCR